MTVAYSALHRHLRYRGEESNFYVLALTDGTTFLSRHQPPLYDREAIRIAMKELLPGSYVNVRVRVERNVNVMEAVQLVREPAQKAPFDRVPDDGHL
jgi:hypothetical protein